jgi:hypothetical protein
VRESPNRPPPLQPLQRLESNRRIEGYEFLLKTFVAKEVTEFVSGVLTADHQGDARNGSQGYFQSNDYALGENCGGEFLFWLGSASRTYGYTMVLADRHRNSQTSADYTLWRLTVTSLT